MRALNSFQCSNNNAKYKEEMTAEELEEVKRYEESREYLDRTYRLCPECDDKVNSFMSEQVTSNNHMSINVNVNHSLMVNFFRTRA